MKTKKFNIFEKLYVVFLVFSLVGSLVIGIHDKNLLEIATSILLFVIILNFFTEKASKLLINDYEDLCSKQINTIKEQNASIEDLLQAIKEK